MLPSLQKAARQWETATSDQQGLATFNYYLYHQKFYQYSLETSWVINKFNRYKFLNLYLEFQFFKALERLHGKTITKQSCSIKAQLSFLHKKIPAKYVRKNYKSQNSLFSDNNYLLFRQKLTQLTSQESEKYVVSSAITFQECITYICLASS